MDWLPGWRSWPGNDGVGGECDGDLLLVQLALGTGAAVLGFLLVNFPHGRLFLGDGGNIAGFSDCRNGGDAGSATSNSLVVFSFGLRDLSGHRNIVFHVSTQSEKG